MNDIGSLFTELNDENALSLLLRPAEEYLKTVEAGANWVKDESTMAVQYEMSANLLRDAAIKTGTPWFYANPILFLYRHAIELYLKGIVRSRRPTHNLLKLRDALISFIKDNYGVDITDGWVTQTISEFADIDPSSTRLRYANDNDGKPSYTTEQVVNLDDLKKRMDALFQVLMLLNMWANN